METKFNFKSAICTSREQSERLLALGLKPATADMGIYYSELYGVDRVFSNDVFDEQPTFDSDEIPAWSLHRLMILAEMKGTAFSDLDAAYETTISIIAAKIRFGYFNKEYLV